MQSRLKTRQRPISGILSFLIKALIPLIVLFVLLFFASKLEMSAPSKIIKQKIPNEQLEITK